MNGVFVLFRTKIIYTEPSNHVRNVIVKNDILLTSSGKIAEDGDLIFF